ncbi:MAG: 4Fe-4S binding protein [Betaproteobacteria bacterium]|nr:4Fe-4S binding protein [Betaproteobacteria bacterium]
MGISAPLVFVPRRRSRLARLGDAMARHRGLIAGVQWGVVLVYGVLVSAPAFLPLPGEHARILDNLTRFAQFLFWGLWWPGVIVSVMLFGRVWCGVLCPEGTLTEWASQRGLGRTIPRWMRWPGWPLAGFLGTTLYGQLIGIYAYPKPVLLILGGSTAAAISVGLVFGRGKRVWCRYLCPVTGVFALLARLSPFHFWTDRAAWKRFPHRAPPVDCPPLLNVSVLSSGAQCHQCGRCSGYRDAISLRWRWPGSEILAAGPQDIGRFEIALLLYGALGFALGAFQWKLVPDFVASKQHVAKWLVAHRILWPFDDSVPWWLLKHYPSVADVFTWLDGAWIAAWIIAHALLLGGIAQLCLVGAGRLLHSDWEKLALGLIPLAGVSLFLGLSLTSLALLRAEDVAFTWAPTVRMALLSLAVAGTLALGTSLIRQARAGIWRSLLAGVLYAAAVALPVWLWVRA